MTDPSPTQVEIEARTQLLEEIALCAKEWCDAVDRGTSWDYWDHRFKAMKWELLPRLATVRYEARASQSEALSTDQPRGVRVTEYGLKLIAEAIEDHFGERPENYDEDVDDGAPHDAWEAFDALSRAALQEAPAPATFKPRVIVNEEAGITEAVFEDVPYIAEPVFEGVYHWMDKHVAMDDGRLVGFAVWKTAPATDLRVVRKERPPLSLPDDFDATFSNQGGSDCG